MSSEIIVTRRFYIVKIVFNTMFLKLKKREIKMKKTIDKNKTRMHIALYSCSNVFCIQLLNHFKKHVGDRNGR